MKNGFAIYLRYFGNYDAVYGSLGAVIAFLFFVYVSANVLLLGAEMAAEWPRVSHGHYDADLARGGAGPSGPWWRKLLASLGALVRSEEEAPEAVDRTPGAGRRERRLGEVRERIRRPGDGGETPPSGEGSGPDESAGEAPEEPPEEPPPGAASPPAPPPAPGS